MIAKDNFDNNIRKDIFAEMNHINEIRRQLEKLLMGKWVEIVSNFNGQPYGHSRKPLTGHQFKINIINFDDSGEISFFLKDGPLFAVGLSDIRFLQTIPQL